MRSTNIHTPCTSQATTRTRIIVVAGLLGVLGCGGSPSPPPTVVAPSVTLTSDSLLAVIGQPIKLTWSSTDATSCAASGAWDGAKSTSGSEVITTSASAPGQVDFTLTCSGAGGSSDATASISINTELTERMASSVAVGSDDSIYSGVIITGALPVDGSGTPVTVSSTADAVKGGSTFVNVQTSQPPTAFLVSITGLAGAPSYYMIDVTQRTARSTTDAMGNVVLSDDRTHVSITVSPSAGRVARAQAALPSSFSYDLLLTFTSQTPENDLMVAIVAQYGATGAAVDRGLAAATPGSLSPPATTHVTFNSAAVSSRSLQVTLSWTADVDLDLHMLPPGGEEIGFDNPSNSGGTLDVDAFPACQPPTGHVEHISWGDNPAPAHVYTIRPNYYDSCGVTAPVRYVVTVTKALAQQMYIRTFDPSEANQDTGTDPGKLVYTAMIDSDQTDAGLLSRLLMAEVANPDSPGGYDASQATTGMKAIRSIVDNRKVSPSTFNASDSSTRGIITAPGQFAGFTGGVSATIEARVARVTTPPDKLEAFKAYWEAVFSIAESSSVDDPFESVTRIGTKDVEPGTWGVKTTGHSSPGSNFVLEPTGTNVSGQDFYTIVTGLIK